MQKLAAVEEARRWMNEGKAWSIWRWLFEKSSVRRAADAGTAALDAAEKKVKAAWPPDLKKAYREAELEVAAEQDPKAARQLAKAREEAKGIDAALKQAARRVKEADDIAYRARMEAEDIFAEAERRLSGSMAREGAEAALTAYDLREKSIRKAEAAARIQTGVTASET